MSLKWSLSLQFWVSLASNGFSVLLGVAGVTYNCWLLASGRPSEIFCSFQTSNADFQTLASTSSVNKWRKRCPEEMWTLDVSLRQQMSVLSLKLFTFHIWFGVFKNIQTNCIKVQCLQNKHSLKIKKNWWPQNNCAPGYCPF